ncbi:hypothetical protein ACLBYD_27385 [Rhodococcus sp. C26F]
MNEGYGAQRAAVAADVCITLIARPAGHAWGWKGAFIASAAARAVYTVVLASMLDRGPVASIPVAQAFLVLPP